MKKRIGLGTWSWGNQLLWDYKISSDNLLRETFQEALRQGFTFIDTADSYGTGKFSGRSENLLGDFISETTNFKKNKIQIATKLAPYPWRVGRKGFNKPFLKSFKRLNKNLDVVQLHWSTAKYNPFQEYQLLNNLCDLIDQGYEFKIGLSNIGPKGLEKIINFLSKRNKKLQSVQVQFSLLSPDIDKQRKVKQICDDNSIDFLAYSPLSFGILCQNAPISEKTQISPLRKFIFKAYDQATLELRHSINQIAQARSVSPAQVAINWCFYQGAIPIVGLRRKSHVVDIAGVLKWDLTNKEFVSLEEASVKCKRKLPSNPFQSN